jgi:hypothetical protein
MPSLYEDHQTLLTERLEIRSPVSPPDAPSEWIASFLPMDMTAQNLTIDLVSQGWGKGFCFATDGAGNFYWTPASESRQPDAPVNFASHDPFRNEQVAPSLNEFLAWPRTPHASDE